MQKTIDIICANRHVTFLDDFRWRMIVLAGSFWNFGSKYAYNIPFAFFLFQKSWLVSPLLDRTFWHIFWKWEKIIKKQFTTITEAKKKSIKLTKIRFLSWFEAFLEKKIGHTSVNLPKWWKRSVLWWAFGPKKVRILVPKLQKWSPVIGTDGKFCLSRRPFLVGGGANSIFFFWGGAFWLIVL